MTNSTTDVQEPGSKPRLELKVLLDTKQSVVYVSAKNPTNDTLVIKVTIRATRLVNTNRPIAGTLNVSREWQAVANLPLNAMATDADNELWGKDLAVDIFTVTDSVEAARFMMPMNKIDRI